VLIGGVTVGAQSRAPGARIKLERGIVISRSVRVAPGVYRLTAPASLDSAVITIRGNDLTVDFAGATLIGTDPRADPDAAMGVGVRVVGGRNVRIVNATIRGYKVGLLARGTRGLTLAHDDLSHNWKPRLFSEPEHESLVDWLSHHHNENDEWLRFGAGAYLADVHGGEIQNVRIEQGMEGLMLVRTDSLRIWNNVIEFNSGVGIGLYRSSDNVIMHNRASYNVRGYSDGIYRRGQDSADLLLYEQSCRNIVAFNSMTHGGDGAFLWAGQSTMDTGVGGANDNLLYRNDFSFAPANGIEATFSRNVFVENRVAGSDYGLWGGYSFDSRMIGNDFLGNRTGIAIEHGQNNTIAGNHFTGDSVAVSLWANPVEPSDWGYPKHRDTRSRDYVIVNNAFARNRVGLRAGNTSALLVGNHYDRVDSEIVQGDSVALRESGGAGSLGITPVSPMSGGIDARALDSLAHRDRSAIIVGEWGPYDWRAPLLWPVDTGRALPARLRVLGPPGEWSVTARRGIASLSSVRGRVGDTIAVTPVAGAERDWQLTLSYRGAAVVSPAGSRTRAGAQYEFSYGRFEPVPGWDVRAFVWSDSTDPRAYADAFTALVRGDRGTPVVASRLARLDLMWYRPQLAGLPSQKWAAVATSTVTLGPGQYTLRAISDDGVRIWVDGRLVVDDWAPHESRVAVAPLESGKHSLRVEYYQVDGWTELRIDVVRGRQRSTGSPGPH
jgi:parallel beta-helix repeat protein